MSNCIWYAKDFDINERILGFVDVSSNQKPDSLSLAIISFLKKLSWTKYQLLHKVMMEVLEVVYKRSYPYAMYIHCMAHKLNLVEVDMCKNIKVSLPLFLL